MRPKYDWTPERDAILKDRYSSRPGTAKTIARVFLWPTWVVKKRAQALGLATPALNRKPWAAEEESFLEEWAGRRSSIWMARRLRRSETSVVLKMKRMQLSRAVREGYTIRDLELCFGVDHRVIERWIRDGKLHHARRRDTHNEHQPYQVSDRVLIEFIRNHPTAFRLDRVDQVWFMDLVIRGGLAK